MTIGILSRRAELYSTRRLVEAARDRGHDVQVINHLLCYMNITARKPSVHYGGDAITHLDAVIPRIGASVSFYGTAVVRQFEMMGVYTVNSSLGIRRSRDKLHSLQLLAREDVELPVTGFAHSTHATDDLIELVGGAPLVVKLLESTQGKGVVLAETRKAAESTIEAFRSLKSRFLVQEFVKEASGTDLRCFVVGGRVVAAMERRGREGDFRSNIHRGGRAEAVEITDEERRTAVHAARVMGLNVAGVDLLRSERGPLVMEVNSSPGLEGIEAATGVDVADAIIDFIERHAEAHRRRRQRTGARPGRNGTGG
jgi:ribosomal protein S6--L-glutamate ligase